MSPSGDFLVDAEAKYRVLTDKEFFENLSRETKGKLAEGLALLYCEIPEGLKREVDAIRLISRREFGS